MGLVHRGVTIAKQEGFGKLFERSRRYINGKLRQLFYSTKATLFDDYHISANGVLINVEDDVISPHMKNVIRDRSYEREESDLIRTHLRRDRPTIDLGAGVGYTTCLIDKHSDESVPVLAVEANELLIPVLTNTRRLNQCDFRIDHSAYHPEKKTVRFQIARDFWESSQERSADSATKEVSVPAKSVADLIEEYELTSPVQLVADIEGSEHDLITNESRTLEEHVGLLIIEFHQFTACSVSEYESILSELGFELVETRENVRVYISD